MGRGKSQLLTQTRKMTVENLILYRKAQTRRRFLFFRA